MPLRRADSAIEPALVPTAILSLQVAGPRQAAHHLPGSPPASRNAGRPEGRRGKPWSGLFAASYCIDLSAGRTWKRYAVCKAFLPEARSASRRDRLTTCWLRATQPLCGRRCVAAPTQPTHVLGGPRKGPATGRLLPPAASASPPRSLLVAASSGTTPSLRRAATVRSLPQQAICAPAGRVVDQAAIACDSDRSPGGHAVGEKPILRPRPRAAPCLRLVMRALNAEAVAPAAPAWSPPRWSRWRRLADVKPPSTLAPRPPRRCAQVCCVGARATSAAPVRLVDGASSPFSAVSPDHDALAVAMRQLPTLAPVDLDAGQPA